MLIYASLGLPQRGPASEVASQETSIAGTVLPSAYYIKNAYRDANTPNMVTVVLADYRSIDTLGEEVVIFTAGLICYMLLWRKRKNAA
jgi:multicomponent Na+:H+ antiporter subunit B